MMGTEDTDDSSFKEVYLFFILSLMRSLVYFFLKASISNDEFDSFLLVYSRFKTV